MLVLLPRVRFSYLNVFKPKKVKGSDKLSFSTALIFPPKSEEHEMLKKIELEVATAAWGEKAAGVLKQLYSANRGVIKDGANRLDDEGNPADGYDGMLFVNASCPSTEPPAVGNRFRQEITPETMGRFTGQFRPPRSGDYGAASIDVWAQDNDFGRRINAKLLAVVLREEGPPLGRKEMSAGERLAMLPGEPVPDDASDLLDS